MPSTRYTVRLPPALDAAVQERLRTAGTPFAILIRDALSAYLADTAPTGRGQRKLTPRQQRALRDKYQRGVSVPALMDEYGISRASVFRYLQSAKR